MGLYPDEFYPEDHIDFDVDPPDFDPDAVDQDEREAVGYYDEWLA